MNTQKTVNPDTKKKPDQLKINLFGMEEKDINVIVLVESKMIKDLVYASIEEENIRRKLNELRTSTVGDYRVMTFKDGKFENTTWQ